MSIKQTITENIIKYSPEELDYNMPENCALLAKGFICKLRLNALPEKREEKELLNIEGFLKLSMQLLNKDEDKEIIRNAGDMYYVYVDKNGNSPILKVTLFVNNESYHPERTILTMGIPLNLYDASKKDVYLLYDGVRLAFIVDGRIVNCEFPFGDTPALLVSHIRGYALQNSSDPCCSKSQMQAQARLPSAVQRPTKADPSDWSILRFASPAIPADLLLSFDPVHSNRKEMVRPSKRQ